MRNNEKLMQMFAKAIEEDGFFHVHVTSLGKDFREIPREEAEEMANEFSEALGIPVVDDTTEGSEGFVISGESDGAQFYITCGYEVKVGEPSA